MAADKKVTMLTIKHLESTHSQEISEDEFNQLQPRIKEKYKITGTKDVATPTELIGK